MVHRRICRQGHRQRFLRGERLEERRVLASLLGTPEALIPRQPLIKPEATFIDLIRHETDRFVVKFQDELPIRLRGGELVQLDVLTRQPISGSSLLDQASVQQVMALVDNGSWERMDRVSEESLEHQRRRAQENLGRAIADLNSYFYVNVPNAENLASIIDAFNSLDIVELAQPMPRPMVSPSLSAGTSSSTGSGSNGAPWLPSSPPPSSPPPPLPTDFEPNQGYLNAAPAGVDARGVWEQIGARGAGVQVVNIEYTFDELHQDLPPITVLGPTPQDPGFGPDHGTAVMGQMGAVDNGWGVTGISPESQYYFAGAFTESRYRLAEALTVATEALNPGDMILIEQQIGGPNFGSGGQFGMVPVEWFEPFYARIVTAVGNGITVVEAAGNGSQNLDDPIYSTGNNGHHPFLEGNDSGAIIVGAGASPEEFGSFQPARSRLGFSNYGRRVDLQGWGHNVWTTGYGDAYSQEGPHLYFTAFFSGTSSASPIVTGAAALVQSAYKDFTGDVLSPDRMRQILRDTGTPQQDGPNPLSQNIGPLPNALAAIEQIFDELRFQVTLSPQTSQYVEDSPPVRIAATSQVQEADFSSGMLMRVTVTNGWQEGDRLTVLSGSGVTISTGGALRFNGTLIGTITPLTQGIAIQFNSQATGESLQAVLRNVGFEHTTGGPTSDPRIVEFRLGGSGRHTVQVNVQPVPDRPIAGEGFLPNIMEDSTQVVGAEISSMTGLFLDPDFGDQFLGVVVVDNPQNALQGTWYYSTNRGVTWLPVGLVNDQDLSLVLSSSAFLAFLPAPDFAGNPEPLRLRVLDSGYSGPFSRIEIGLRQPFLPVFSNAVSTNVGSVGVLVVNVNDPPRATIPSLSLSVAQDQMLQEIFPSDYFVDIDSQLQWSVTRQGGFDLPAWLSFSPGARRLSGIPRNPDVGTYSLVISARDQDFVAAIPLTLIVTNVNDRPEQLRFEPLQLTEGISEVWVGTLHAIDPDGDEITWTSSDPRINMQGNRAILNSAVDFETEQRIPVTFRATDNGAPPRFAEIHAVLSVIDVNEFYPDLVGETFVVKHGTPGGDELKILKAPDGDSLQTVRFRLRGGDQSAFTLNENTGSLRFLLDADIRNRSEYRVFVEAFDNGTPRFSTTAQFSVVIVPANDFAPVVASNQQLTFSENLPAGRNIGQVLASDPDENPLRYEILEVIGGATNWLQINPESGSISLTAASGFDFESGVEHAVRVRVAETIEPFRAVEATIPISVLDSNDPPHAMGSVSMLTSRMGVSSQALSVSDQDPSPVGYSFSTADPRFEIRDGRLALRPNQFFPASLAGTFTTAVVRVMDQADPRSVANLSVNIQIVLSLPWQNPLNPLDTNRDGRVSSLDALVIINELNAEVIRQLNNPRRYDQLSLPDFDTSGDGRISSLDALLVINRLNSQLQAEGESAEQRFNPQTWMMAYEMIEENDRRRRR